MLPQRDKGGTAKTDFLLETGKCGCQVAAPLKSFLQTSLQDIWVKVRRARGSLKGPIPKSPNHQGFSPAVRFVSNFIPNPPPPFFFNRAFATCYFACTAKIMCP